ncbi:MAG TPA: hypothetical protein VJT72_17625 [Pseudonocardiaceae bacterium]|nr:hypothetical protein [Pseudonocardiaceae bacterium]
MPDPDNDLEARLAVLEREVARLREQTALTSAGEMREGFTAAHAEMREGFAKTREGFAKQAVGTAQITALLTKIAGPESLD